MKITIGKYKGRLVSEIFKIDINHINWIINNNWYQDKEVKEYCKKYLEDFMKSKYIDEEDYKSQDELFNLFKEEYKDKKKEELIKIIDIF
jgi:anaerobic selenocysteine-containing dehydrogenase